MSEKLHLWVETTNVETAAVLHCVLYRQTKEHEALITIKTSATRTTREKKAIKTQNFPKMHWVQKGISHAWILIVISGLVSWEGVQTWNYEYSQTNMTWPAARQYCQKFFTDLVAIQNQEEINYLNQMLPRNPTYYWIGIRKIGGVWTWVGTNKSLGEEAENWAAGEPTPGGEDCVEIYIKRGKEAGKWNNEPCTEREKRALCYLASCKAASCSGNGECVEVIGNYTCRCNEGFNGPECEYVVKCDDPKLLRNGYRNCSPSGVSFTYTSVCNYSCVEGFSLNGADSVQCVSSGRWSSPTPTCEVVKCDDPQLPRNGYRNCSTSGGGFTYTSVCNYGCVEGFTLNGAESLQCDSSGRWSSPTPTCEVVKCDDPQLPRNGYRNCSPSGVSFTYTSVCNYSCVEGFSLNGTDSVQCDSSGRWSSPTPTCEGVKQRQYVAIGTAGAASAVLLSLPFLGYIIRQCRKKAMKERLAL
ncbi:L-selectin-like isoform X2 [Leucoraja erinacea]|uniref:L-selectin-like isoform X2 n=1 Tax=Leucoraja erinaceus TaxID=7782 RepID=UPI0024547134|nr:L-selectin-like isoform X2 [Leucoraja erinacea]